MYFNRQCTSRIRKKWICFRFVGDYSLYVAGYFSESLNRKLVDVDYYIDIGRSAYQSLANVARSQVRQEIFSGLHQKFPSLVEVLTEISFHTNSTTAEDLIRLYDRWLKTGSSVLEKKTDGKGDSNIRQKVKDCLNSIQQDIEKLNDIHTGIQIGDFLIDDIGYEQLAKAGHIKVASVGREAFSLFHPVDDEYLDIAIYLSDSVSKNLLENSFHAFLIAVEEVSHVIYTIYKSSLNIAIKPLEIETQSELDRYAVTALRLLRAKEPVHNLPDLIFTKFKPFPGLNSEEVRRYSLSKKDSEQFYKKISTQGCCRRQID